MNLSIAILAALLTLAPGYNNTGAAGEVVAVSAATSNATATVAIKSVNALTTYTNTTAQVVTYEPAWRVTMTNYNASGGRLGLPDNCFPITATRNSDSASVSLDSDDVVVVFIEGSLERFLMLESEKTLDPWSYAVCGFYTEPPYQYSSDNFAYSNVLFAGTAGIESTSPNLVYIVDPATYVTNVVGYLNYDDFKWTNGVSTIVGDPVRFDMPTTNTVVTGQAISGYYAATNDIGTVTTSAHFGQAAITNKVLFGGGVLVTGATDGDIINLLIK